MKTYTIRIYLITRTGRELCEILEMQRPRFTHREYKDILIPHLFYLACRGIDYRWLCAEIDCDGENVLTALCETSAEGSAIRATIVAARPHERFRRMRTMTIAE